MGVDAKAVVDPSSMKVHGLEGLRIADASVIPRMISGNLQNAEPWYSRSAPHK